MGGKWRTYLPDCDVHDVEKKIRKSFTEGVGVYLGSWGTYRMCTDGLISQGEELQGQIITP